MPTIITTRRADALVGLGPAVLLLITCTPLFAGSVPAAAVRAPYAWGMLSPPRACVIFREYSKTKFGFYVIVVTTRTQSQLEVIETTNGYVLDPRVWVEDENGMQDLQRRALKDAIRYVKVADKYTPAELDAARALCQQYEVAQ
jgi:hypothetical protein